MNERRYQIRETDHPTLRYAVIDTWKDSAPDPRYQSHAEAFARACFLNDHPAPDRTLDPTYPFRRA